jgi:hypothetical protein
MPFDARQLNDLTDDDLRTLVTTATDLLQQRHEAAKQRAIEEARARLAEVGLTFRDLTGGPPPRKRAAKLRNGDRYTNPLDPSQVHVVDRGRPPKWFTDMETRGTLPAPSRPGPDSA